MGLLSFHKKLADKENRLKEIDTYETEEKTGITNWSHETEMEKTIVFEKGYTEQCAEWMAERLEALTDHLQYGHAAIAYQKQNGDFRLVKATLIYYETEFHKSMIPHK